jgi:hypothetical protein
MSYSALTERLFAEIVVSCEHTGCKEVFLATEPATDSVEAWAERAAIQAQRLGWSEHPSGKVLCPTHSGELRSIDSNIESC